MSKHGRGLRELCALLGYSRQAYYRYQTALSKQVLQQDLLLQQVALVRRVQPRLGARKLLIRLAPFMQQQGIRLGRDGFFTLLQAHGLLIRGRKRRSAQTTFSDHAYRRYPDLLKGLTVHRPEQVWVSDITYIRLTKGFAYLGLITDAYSRKIVGYALAPELSVSGPLAALGMALAGRSTAAPLLHHSDRGVQYCCGSYVEQLRANQVHISMTQGSDPRDNALAERVNGILKQELLAKAYTTVSKAKAAVEQAIALYNEQRPHSSLDMLTPQAAHTRQGPIARRWKSYYKQKAKEAIMDS